MAISLYLRLFVLSLAAFIAGDIGEEDADEIASAAMEESRSFYNAFAGDAGSFIDTDEARALHNARLQQKIAIVDRVCGLTNTQKEKLQLAGHGDTRRLFDRVEEVGRQLELVKHDQPNVDGLFRKNESLRTSIHRNGLTCDDSLFVKVLETILTAEQHVQFEPLRLAIFKGGEIQALQVDLKVALEVNLSGRTAFDDEGLAGLSKLPDIYVLRLDRTRVTDAGLATLKGLTIIYLLELAETKVTDAGLAELTGLTSLYWLALRNTQVSDAGLEHLKAMNNLTLLVLEGTQVTDAGLAHLKEVTSLRWLSLQRTQVTDAGVAELKAVLPNLTIER